MTFFAESSVGNSFRFDGLADHAVERLDGVSGVDRFSNVLRIVEQRVEIVPTAAFGRGCVKTPQQFHPKSRLHTQRET
jgi:hypothetical protein